MTRTVKRISWLVTVAVVLWVFLNLDLPLPQGGGATTGGYAVKRVLDGDSVLLSLDGATVEVRLAGIDAPEHRQPYGEAAKRELRQLLRGQDLSLQIRDRDRYGRTIAVVRREDGMDVNEELVRRGAAWVHRSYGDADWFLLERKARSAGSGLWGLEGVAVPPWEWRREHPRSSK